MRKIFDLSVKDGEYPDGRGGTKIRWLNIGALFQDVDESGKKKPPFILLNRTFTPAGAYQSEKYRELLVYLFPPKEKNRDNN